MALTKYISNIAVFVSDPAISLGNHRPISSNRTLMTQGHIKIMGDD